jgi:ribonuclease HII
MKAAIPTRQDEQRLWVRGYHHVAGVDEVGRGCLAGPLTVAAVVLPHSCKLNGVRDSKLLTPQQRWRVAAEIKAAATAIGIGWASSREIDQLGLTLAQRRAGERALDQIMLPEAALILDGKHNYLGGEIAVTTIVRADQSCLVVAAASVIAKVARDRYLELLHTCLPDYGFSRHKGYGSREHLEALQRLGPTPYHRHSYQPLRMLTRVG